MRGLLYGAVAAVGTQHLHEAIYTAVEEAFYDLARHYQDDMLQLYPLDAIKVCTLLAMYNVFNKANVALAYVD